MYLEIFPWKDIHEFLEVRHLFERPSTINHSLITSAVGLFQAHFHYSVLVQIQASQETESLSYSPSIICKQQGVGYSLCKIRLEKPCSLLYHHVTPIDLLKIRPLKNGKGFEQFFRTLLTCFSDSPLFTLIVGNRDHTSSKSIFLTIFVSLTDMLPVTWPLIISSYALIHFISSLFIDTPY